MASFRLLLLAFLTLGLFSACGDDNDDPAAPVVRVRLTDAPGDYEKVIVDILGVQLKPGDGDFTDLDENYAGSYDLIELTNGKDTLIAVSDMPAGEVDQIRLLLGDDNFVQIDGQQLALTTPSAQESGLKVKVDGPALEPGKTYELVLDFDAGRSVVEAGNSGKYNLKPVLRARLREIELETDGQITGQVTPADQQYVIAYPAGGDTLGTYVGTEGFFTFREVPVGSYTIEVWPNDMDMQKLVTVDNVAVTAGEVTDLGVITLE